MRYLNENFQNIVNEPVPIGYGDAILTTINQKFNELTGQNILEFGTGCVYEGYTYKNLPFYKGVMTCKDFTYHGKYRDGIEHGYGILTMKSGDVYEGEFFNGAYHGKNLSFQHKT